MLTPAPVVRSPRRAAAIQQARLAALTLRERFTPAVVERLALGEVACSSTERCSRIVLPAADSASLDLGPACEVTQSLAALLVLVEAVCEEVDCV